MNKNELQKILKPLIKECVREIIFEERGALSHIISEVAGGLSNNKQPIVEASSSKHTTPATPNHDNKKALMERKRKLLDAIGKDAYGGVDLFEGTTPTTAPVSEGSARGALSDVAPNDPGVNISNIVSGKSAAIFKRMMEKK